MMWSFWRFLKSNFRLYSNWLNRYRLWCIFFLSLHVFRTIDWLFLYHRCFLWYRHFLTFNILCIGLFFTCDSHNIPCTSILWFVLFYDWCFYWNCIASTLVNGNNFSLGPRLCFFWFFPILQNRFCLYSTRNLVLLSFTKSWIGICCQYYCSN